MMRPVLRLFKKFSFWLALLAGMVVVYNMMGEDDKSLLLFFTSPPFWIMEWFDIRMSISVYYVVHILFWFLLGYGIDKAIARLTRR